MQYPWKAVIFDMDGTLACSMGVWRKIEIQFLDRRGIVMPDDYGAALRTMSYQEAAAYTISRFSLPETIPDVIREWHEMAVFEYGHTIELKDGAKEFIEALRKQGVKIALATVSSRELYEPFLRNKGIYQYFDVCVDTSQVQRGKGYPDIYLFAVQELSRSLEHPIAPSDCIVFEDVLQAVQAARSGGFQTCGVYDSSSDEEWSAIQMAADMTIESFTQLLWMGGSETCNCKRTKCRRHGKCSECIAYHRANKRYRTPHCMRLGQKATENNGSSGVEFGEKGEGANV